MKYLIDSDVLIDILLGKAWAITLYELLKQDGAAISAMTYGEVWEGIEANPERTDAIDTLADIVDPLSILDIDVPIMQVYGRIRIHLRRHGEMIGTPDILIASSAIEHHLTLVTRNTRHFGRIPNLQILHPSEIGS